MSIHGSYVMDDSKYIRPSYGEDGELVRVHLHEDWYDRLKLLYDYFDLIAAGVSVESIPDDIDEAFQWLSALVFEVDILGIGIVVHLIGWVRGLVERRIGLGKFKYGSGGFGEQKFGGAPFGAVIKILELPVEG